MINRNYYCVLSNYDNVNECVHYISAIDAIIDKCKPNNSIVDLITEMLKKKQIENWQIKPIIYKILIDKWNYRSASINLPSPLKDVAGFIKKVSSCKAVDIILKHEHPEFGCLLINPKDSSSVPLLEMLKKNELLVLYVGYQGGKDQTEKISQTVIEALLQMLKNIKTPLPKKALTGKFVYTKKAKKYVAKNIERTEERKDKDVKLQLNPINMGDIKIGDIKTSQILSVMVSNELFHNGNVEAWKNIIRSYTTKYRGAKVLIFYEGQRILNINALFKWGKVRYGSVIEFAVMDEKIRALSKLFRYLKEGASPHFKFFLTPTPDAILNLF